MPSDEKTARAGVSRWPSSDATLLPTLILRPYFGFSPSGGFLVFLGGFGWFAVRGRSRGTRAVAFHCVALHYVTPHRVVLRCVVACCVALGFRRGRARFLRRHGRGMIGRSGSFRAYYAFSAELAGASGGGDGGRSVIIRRE